MDAVFKDLLIIDDDDVMREKFRRMLDSKPYHLTEADSGSAATKLLESNEFDCVLLDHRLGDTEGLNLLPIIQAAIKRPCPIIMITGVDDERLIVEAMRNGAYDYISKHHLHSESLTTIISAGLKWAELESKLRESQAKLQHLSLYDSLTSLPNRHLFFDRLEQARLIALRESTHFALLMMDLNMFKEVNDIFGHAAGDQILCQVAQRLKTLSRESDTYARLGGDEFAAILLNVNSEESAGAIAEKIIQYINTPFMVDDKLINLGISIGISLFPDHGNDTQLLMAKADSCMYKAKHGSRGYEAHNDAGATDLQPALMIASYLSDALTQHEFTMQYQPQIDLVTGECCGVEALARWHNSALGTIHPEAFIRAAERSAVIIPLTYELIDIALKQARLWLNQQIKLPISVNLSAKLLDDVHLVDNIKQLLVKHEIPPEWLTLEITETALMVSPSDANLAIRALTDIGIQISIDDFGTGYTSFKYLRQFQLNELKIDQMFVKDLTLNSSDASIVQSFVSLTQGFKIKLIAEGVETFDKLKLLKQMGCGRAQGYWISRAMDGEAIPDWLNAWQQHGRLLVAQANPPE